MSSVPTNKHGSDLSVKTALHLCSSHLKGVWDTSSKEDIDLRFIQAGFVNRLFICHNKKSNYKVIIRLYGGKVVDTPETTSLLQDISIEGEVLIFHLMDVNRIGPKLLGVFDGGRIEEYLNGCRELSDRDCTNPEIMVLFARKLAKLHSMNIPIRKTPKDLIKLIRHNFDQHWPGYHRFLTEKEFSPEIPQEIRTAAQFAVDYDFVKLIDWFEETLTKIRTRVVFSHNDMNRANFMINPSKSGDDKLTFLDFESCGYNHRGCDIGQHFKFRSIDVNMYTEGKSACDSAIPYPSEEERRHFVRSYLEVAKQSYESVDDSLDSEDHVLLEAEFFGGLYTLYFTSAMFNTVEKCKEMSFPMHPAVIMTEFNHSDLEQRKSNTINLLRRFHD